MSEDWFEVTVARGIVRAHHARSARNETEARAVLAAIDAALQAHGIDVLMFDSRDADRTPAEVQAVIWAWLQERVEIRKIATLMHSAELSKRVRATSAGQGVRLRTFDDEEEARIWLQGR